jgi:hypothetical protein
VITFSPPAVRHGDFLKKPLLRYDMLKSSLINTIRTSCTTLTDIIFDARYQKTENGHMALTKEQFTRLAELREYLYKTLVVIDRQKNRRRP